MHLLRFTITALLSLTLVQAISESFQHIRRHSNQLLEERGKGGWSSVQYPSGATESDIPIRGGLLRLFAMNKKGLEFSKITRVVWVLHGQGRDPWNYYSHMTSALNDAVSTGLVKEDEVGIWAPSFWDTQDTGAFPWDASKPENQRATSNIMAWDGSDWARGEPNVLPYNGKGVSSFEVIDDVIRYFGNKAIFPNVDTIVLASHSAGAQMLDRYAKVGNIPTVAPEVHFYIGNPASYMYFDERRPQTGIGGAISRSKCPTWNDFKYGLNNIRTKLSYSPIPSTNEIIRQFNNRFVHYQIGLNDHGPGSDACGATVQGDSHRTRGEIYQAYLALLGNYPSTHTIDYIEGVSHNDKAMFSSQYGQYRLFVQNNRQGKTKASAMPNGYSNGLQVEFTNYAKKASDNMP